MQLTQSPKFNRNYAAKIVEIKDFIKHPNPKCERLKCCTIDGYSIAVSIDTNPGTYVYFPIECAIDDRFLSANNLFRDKVKNVDKGQAGFFEDNCRVKIIKLQGYPSEGFITPITYLYNWLTLIGKNNEVALSLTLWMEKSYAGSMFLRLLTLLVNLKKVARLGRNLIE